MSLIESCFTCYLLERIFIYKFEIDWKSYLSCILSIYWAIAVYLLYGVDYLDH